MLKPNAVQRTTEGILTLIEHGRLVGGSPLAEIELAERLGVARSTIREALGKLESKGIATSARGRGLIVRRLDRRDVADLYELREQLEAFAAHRAALQQRTEAAWPKGQINKERRLWQLAVSSHELTSFSEANRSFHQRVIGQAGNRHLPDMLDRTLMILFTGQFRSFLAPSSVHKAAADHLKILLAIEQADGPAAERAMRAHIRSSAEQILGLPDEAFD